MRTRMAWGWIAVAGLACGGCGFKGPLYLPERNATVVTHPPRSAQGAPPPGQTQTPASKNKGKSSPPSSSPHASPPQSPQPPPPAAQ